MVARSIRIEFPGAFYHVMARGNRRGRIFRDAEDREVFLKTLGEACARSGWRVHAWTLMNNHYHLLLETPEGNLVAGMQWLQNTYTRRFNHRHRFWGRLFGDRYKAVLVEAGEGYYYETLLDYIHLNAVRAGLVQASAGQSVSVYRWSSVGGGCALLPWRRPKWLAAQSAIEAFGFADTASGRRRWVERLDRRAAEESSRHCGLIAIPENADARRSHLRRGWYWGSQRFAEAALKLAEKTLSKGRERGYGASLEHQAHDTARAQELLGKGLKAAGLTAEAVRRLPGSDPRKVAVARVIWSQTTVSQSWLAEHLAMGSAANVSQQMRRQAPRPLPKLSSAFRQWLVSVKN